MKKTYLYMLLCLFLLAFFSCEDKGDNDKYSIELDKYTITVDVRGGEESIRLIANGDWRMSGIPEWLSLSPLSGSNAADISIVATENKELTRHSPSDISFSLDVPKLQGIRVKVYCFIPYCAI